MTVDEGQSDHVIEPFIESPFNNQMPSPEVGVGSDELNHTLKEILSNQKSFQQQMQTLIKRVDTIEGSITSPSSSSSDAEKTRKKRIPSALSVSFFFPYLYVGKLNLLFHR